MTDSTSTLLARYAFDPWGRRTVTGGTDVTSVGYAGYRWHASGELALTLHRAYDAGLARWVSEDPLGIEGGINLFAYAENNSIRFTDPLGLAIWIGNRAAWRGWVIEGMGNHSYLWDDRNKQCCGRGSQTQCKEGGPGVDPGTVSRPSVRPLGLTGSAMRAGATGVARRRGRSSAIVTEPTRIATATLAVVEQLSLVIAEYIERPTVVVGHSMGALIASEVANALRGDGQRLPDLMVVSASPASHWRREHRGIYNWPDSEVVQELSALAGTQPAGFTMPVSLSPQSVNGGATLTVALRFTSWMAISLHRSCGG